MKTDFLNIKKSNPEVLVTKDEFHEFSSYEMDHFLKNHPVVFEKTDEGIKVWMKQSELEKFSDNEEIDQSIEKITYPNLEIGYFLIYPQSSYAIKLIEDYEKFFLK